MSNDVSPAIETHAAERILGAIRRGSSWPVLVRTRAGRFVTKLRGAAQGIPALIAEVIVAELATRLDLPVPERAIVTVSADTPSDDANDELADLRARSVGENLGFRLLEGATDLSLDRRRLVDAETAARIVWLDGLVMNPDRTERNPNVLLWHRRPWLIDHGACLPFHHDWSHVTEASPREPGPSAAGHLLASVASPLRDVDETCASRLGRGDLTSCVARVPESFLRDAFPTDAPARIRAAYVAFLWKRLRPPRPFLGAS
ncbi:MAG TPA: HipA family kinase [Polyangiaceae bacterium]|nr:HipA family kinase [Polyangiaceae bacterium]